MTPTRHKTAAFTSYRHLFLLVIVLVLVILTRHIVQKNPSAEKLTSNPAESPYEAETAILGTYAKIKFWANPGIAERATSEIFEQLHSLHRTINLFDPESELSRLNTTGHEAPFPCSEMLWNILTATRQAHEETDGIFDPSVAPLMRLWGFHRDRNILPRQDDIDETRALVGLNTITFNDTDRTVHFSKAGTHLDFGGIAKGFALDMAVKTAKRLGIRSGLIDLGGNIYCFPIPPPRKSAYSIGVRNPFDRNKLLTTIHVRNTCIATSGNYENFREIQGERVTHIIDPRTGKPVSGVASTTIVTPNGVDSDVFSTAIFIGGDTMAKALVKSRKNTSILRVTLDTKGQTQISKYSWPW